ncbi:MAG TPA: hypothetical protein VKM94_09565 [Blastocatellia bacterium]|nr:hypothetical protein [Blastocatellia bacterium]
MPAMRTTLLCKLAPILLAPYLLVQFAQAAQSPHRVSLALVQQTTQAPQTQTPQSKAPPPLAEMQQGRELIYQGKLDEALRRFEKISTDYPRSPAGDFYQIVTLIWKSRIDAKLDAGTREFDAKIESILDSVNTKAEALRAAPDHSIQDENDALYFLGSAAATRARISLYQNHGLPAAKQARLAEDLFEELIKRDPEYYDAYYAPGAIYYAVGMLTDTALAKVVVNMLGPKALPAGDIEKGRSYLSKAAQNAPLANIDAKLALLEIYALNENRFDLALPIAVELRSKYPANQVFTRYLMKVYSGLNDRKRLSEICKEVLGWVKEGRPYYGSFMKAEVDRYLAEAGDK